MPSTLGSPSSATKKGVIWASLWMDYSYGKGQRTGNGQDAAGNRSST